MWASTGGFMQGTRWWPQRRGADLLLSSVACGQHVQKEGWGRDAGLSPPTVGSVAEAQRLCCCSYLW